MKQTESAKQKQPSVIALTPPFVYFILRVQKFQVSYELCFVFQLYAYFPASEKELRWTSMSFLPYQNENVRS